MSGVLAATRLDSIHRGVPVLRHPLTPRHPAVRGNVLRVVAVLGLLLSALGATTGPVAAADAPTMQARIMLGGHARIGSWVAIAVHLKNDGPAVSGELRLSAGASGQTRFVTVVDLPTGSDKTYVLYAQPPSFGSTLEVTLVDGDTKVASATAPFIVHDATQLVVAVIAEHPDRIVGNLDLLPNQNQVNPVVVSITPDDLPERVEAWGTIDRIIWQDVESSRLSTRQLDALRGWVAGGGRLVIAGGTLGPKALAAFPDVLLPYRPVVTTDVPAASLSGILGELPSTATTLPALSGQLVEGRALATVGDQVVAAERGYGSGSVTLLGFDPSVDWIAKTDTAQNLWRRLLPPRTSGGLSFSDDNMLVSAVSQLPALALPPVGGLLVLLVGYILLIGPLNYLVLRRLDRREWAWFTMPILIIVFAVGAYAFGAVLRGNDLIVNEIAIVRGAPGAADGTAQVYFGVFSPSRGVYQLQVPGGALLSAPINGDFFGGTGTGTTTLDVVQGDPAYVRDLSVGFGSLRAIRAETSTTVPLIQASLRLEDGHLKGTVKNASSQRLERPAVVLGGTVVVLDDLEPGAQATVDSALQPGAGFGQSLSDKVVGQMFFSDTGGVTAESSRIYVRHNMIDQLSYDPNFGPTGQLPSGGAVVLAWGSSELLSVQIDGQKPQQLGNVLYYLPTDLAISGQTTFSSDLIRSTTVSNDAVIFSKDPTSISFGRGSATMAYRPIDFTGTLTATELAIGLQFGDPGISIPPTPITPLASIPPACTDPTTQGCQQGSIDGMAETEVFDLTAQTWRRLPHLTAGSRYAVADPARFVDPTTGTVLVRFVNDRTDPVGFQVSVSISGVVR